MIELTDKQASVLKQGYPVRVFVPELGEDVVVVLAAQRESTESVPSKKRSTRSARKRPSRNSAGEQRFPG